MNLFKALICTKVHSHSQLARLAMMDFVSVLIQSARDMGKPGGARNNIDEWRTCVEVMLSEELNLNGAGG